MYKTKVPYQLFAEGRRRYWPKKLKDKIFVFQLGQKVLLSRSAYLKSKNIFVKPSLQGSFARQIFYIEKRLIRKSKKGIIIPVYQLSFFNEKKEKKIFKGLYYPTELIPVYFIQSELIKDREDSESELEN